MIMKSQEQQQQQQSSLPSSSSSSSSSSWFNISRATSSSTTRRRRNRALTAIISIALVLLLLEDEKETTFIIQEDTHQVKQQQQQQIVSVQQQQQEEEDASIPDSLFRSTPLCNGNGTICGEDPTTATPRTVYSSPTKRVYHKWWEIHETLKQNATKFDDVDDNKPSLIFLGDSITESWLGTGMGQPQERAEGVPQVLKDEFGGEYKTLVLAIGGDQVQHLLWRVHPDGGGELTDKVRNDPSATFVIMIGTNNVGRNGRMLPEPTVRGIVHLVRYLLDHVVRGRLLVFQLLPRGAPGRIPGKMVIKVNEGLVKELFHNTSSTDIDKNRVKLIDCGSDFLIVDDDGVSSTSSSTSTTGGGGGGGGADDGGRSTGESSSISNTSKVVVNQSLMPDRLHPNAEGHKILAACIKKYL